MAVTVHAAVSFESGKRYRFVCSQWNTGAVALGANHGSTALVYYYLDSTTPEDGWWYVENNGAGYTLQNAQSKEYLYYEGTREESVAKGIRLTDTGTGNTAAWAFHATDNGFYITNVAQPGQYINVRTDGTNLVGTYAEGSTPTDNEIFTIYDEDGKQVLDDGNTGGNTDNTSPFEGATSGITSTGEYWELTGLDQPVVLTTDTSDPVYYTIQNVRKGNYLYVSGSSLSQTSEASNATRFYFVQDQSGVHVCTESGYYVSTHVRSYGGSSNASMVYAFYGTPGSGNDNWTLDFYADEQYPGYTLQAVPDGWSSSSTENSYWNDYNGTSICFYSADGGSTFRFFSSDERHLDHLTANGVKIEGVTPRLSFASLVDSIRFDLKDLVYRKDTKSYMFNVRPKYRNGLTYTPAVEVRFKEPAAGYELRIDSLTLSAAGTIDFPNISGLDDHKLQVWQADSIVATARLNFTFLPIVEINVPSVNATTYTTGTIRVNYFQAAGYDSTYIAAYRYRGASAQSYAKKSYAVKLRDTDGNSVDREFLGYRDDNNWILDAMAVDPACMRNRVSTDLWNDFSHDPYHKGSEPKARTGTRGKFVEVLLNGNYHGIYCMTEKMDRKQLKLKKSEDKSETVPEDIVHSVLYKSSDWNYEVFFGHDTDKTDYTFPNQAPAAYDNTNRQEVWRAFEIKYPDYETQAIDWKPLWDGINFVATSDDTYFAGWVQEYFDYPVLIDYYLFIELMLATDNHGKNMFYYVYDTKAATNNRKLGIAPWDMDGTWGRRWDGSSYYTSAEQDFPTFLDRLEHGQLSYYYRLNKSSFFNWSDVLKARYAELRGTYFAEDALIGRFAEYAEIFEKSGADKREQERWGSNTAFNHRDIQGDVDFIAGWVRDRLAYLDNQYGYTPGDPSTGLDNVKTNKYLGATGGKGCIEFHIFEPQTVSIYALNGRLVRTVRLADGLTTVSGFQPGVYVANGTKVIVK